MEADEPEKELLKGRDSMAWQCPDCGKERSRSSFTCPHCGCPGFAVNPHLPTITCPTCNGLGRHQVVLVRNHFISERREYDYIPDRNGDKICMTCQGKKEIKKDW